MPRAVKIEEIRKHPTLTKVSIVKVSDGQKSFEVICGAQNLSKVERTVFIENGEQLPNGFKVTSKEYAGVNSGGMLCSAKDLSVSNESGIISLPQDIPPGMEIKKIPKIHLSSVPWHEYKFICAYTMNDQSDIEVTESSEKVQGKVLSITYFSNGQYIHRNFL